ncbi:MAG: hypothetical protein U0414_37755 [Polyangiaceae bacterium]
MLRAVPTPQLRPGAAVVAPVATCATEGIAELRDGQLASWRSCTGCKASRAREGSSVGGCNRRRDALGSRPT